MGDRYLLLPRIVRPEPGTRFDARCRIYEPYALKYACTDLFGRGQDEGYPYRDRTRVAIAV